MFFSILFQSNPVFAQSDNSTSLNSNCQNKILPSAVNETKAILFAVNSDQFKSAVNESDVNFDYVYYRLDKICGGVQTVNVLFHVRLPSYVATLVIKEDPLLTKIIDVIESPVFCEGICRSCDCFTGTSLQKVLRTLDKSIPTINPPSPKYQLENGILPKDVVCAENLVKMKSNANKIVCVKSLTASKLSIRGWGIIVRS